MTVYYSIRMRDLGLPGGAVDKNLLASAEDMGSISGPGRFYMLWINEARIPQLLKSVCSRARNKD